MMIRATRTEKIPWTQLFSLVYQIWRRDFLQFRRTWLISVIWIIMEPLFILGSIGFGLGSYVSTIQGVSYVEFFYPGLICSSSMFVAYFVSTYDNFTKLTHQQLFATFMLSPMEAREIVLGEVLWAATKGTISAAGVSVIASFFGLVESWYILPAMLIVFLSSVVFAAFGMLVTTFVENYDQIIYPSSGLIIPMSLFSGTYFPIEHLPVVLKYLVYIFPLTHAVRAVRALLLDGFDGGMVLNCFYLIVLAYFLVHWSAVRLNNKILN